MPQYLFVCDSKLGGCDHPITFECLMAELSDHKPKSCPKCHKRKSVRQVFSSPVASVPKTLGSLADKNHARMSDDEKHFITEKNTAYRRKSGKWHSTPEGITHD